MSIHKRKPLDQIVLTSLILIVIMSLASGLMTSQNPCSECHTTFNERCSFNPTDSSAVLPTTLTENQILLTIPIIITGSGANNFYRIQSMVVTVTSENGYVDIQNPQQTWNNLYPGAKIFFTTIISGKQKGTDQLTFQLSASNVHHNVRFSDTYSYPVDISLGGTDPLDPAVQPSTWSLYLTEKQATFQLIIQRDITQLHLTSPDTITVTPQTIDSIPTGSIVNVTITVESEKILEGNITITWTESTSTQTIHVPLTYQLPIMENASYYSLIGRILGLSSFALLLTSIIFSGITRRIRVRISTVISSKKRIRMHCLVSWSLLAVAIIHGGLLLLGPYADFVFKPEIILGYLTAISMGTVGVNGSFQKVIVNKFGSRFWWRTHRYYSYTALILCIVHAVLIGTDFAVFRSLW